MEMRVGFIHTVPDVVSSADTHFSSLAPHVLPIHIVRKDLLYLANQPTSKACLVAEILHTALALERLGSQAILVTCSSIGEAAETAACSLSVPLMRIDTAMAKEVKSWSLRKNAPLSIAVLATLPSTVGPSARLVEKYLNGRARVVPIICEGAAEARAAGKQREHDRLIVDQANQLGEFDALVLAQASMSSALENTSCLMPVFTSSTSGVKAFVDLIHTFSDTEAQ